MLTLDRYKRNRRLKIFIFLAAVFTFIMLWAVIQPLSVSPDEGMRYQIVEFITKHGFLPDGRDPEIRNEIWGISYAFYPILSYMIMALPAKVASLLSADPMAMVIASRVVNAIFGTIMAYLTFRISEMLFEDDSKYVFTALVTFLPGVVFVHSYINNDSMALLATAWITYAWVRSVREGWTAKICIHLAAAIAMCALSYLNAYGFILCSIVFFFTTILIGNKMENKAKFVAARTALIVILVLALAGWWFVRNYLLYNDFLGWSVTSKYAEMYAMDGFKPSQRLNLAQNGVGVLGLLTMQGTFTGNWTLTVIVSFIGTFGYLDLFMSKWVTVIYLIIFLVGTVGFILSFRRLFALTEKTGEKRCFRKMGMFNWCMLLMVIITIALLIYYNLYSDFQPQGRYLLPMVIPFMYFLTVGIRRLAELIIKNEKIRNRVYLAISILLIALVVFTYVKVFYPTYMG